MEENKVTKGEQENTASQKAKSPKKDKSHYISAAESRNIAKENFRTTKALEKRKKRKNVPESEFVTEMHDPANVVEFDDLHTYFFTDAGTVKAVDGVSFSIPQGSTVGVVGESGCGKSVTSLSLMQLVQAPQGQIVSGSIRFRSFDLVRDADGAPIPVYELESGFGGGFYPVLKGTGKTTNKLYPELARDGNGNAVFTRDILGAFVPVYRKTESGEVVYSPIAKPVYKPSFCERVLKPKLARDEQGRLIFEEDEEGNKRETYVTGEDGKPVMVPTYDKAVKKVKLKFTAPVLVPVKPSNGEDPGFERIVRDGYVYRMVHEDKFSIADYESKERPILRAVVATDRRGCFVYEKDNVGEFVPVYERLKSASDATTGDEAVYVAGIEDSAVIRYEPAYEFKAIKPKMSEQPVELLKPVQKKNDEGFDEFMLEDKTFDIAKMPTAEMRRLRGKEIAMIFQEPMTSLNPVFTIGYQLDEVSLLHTPGATKASAKSRSIEMLNLVGIAMAERVYNSYPHELSGGMRQRVMIAMALACNPKLIIADEPTTALDVTIQAQILDLLREIKAKINGSIMLITHDLGVIAEMADFVVVMYAGRIVEMGTAKEIFENPLHPYTIGLQKSKPVVNKKVDRLYSIRGQVPNPINMPHYCYFKDRCDLKCEACSGEYPKLRQVTPTHSVSCYKYSGGGEKK